MRIKSKALKGVGDLKAELQKNSPAATKCKNAKSVFHFLIRRLALELAGL